MKNIVGIMLKAVAVGACFLVGASAGEGAGQYYISVAQKAFENKDYVKTLRYLEEAASMGSAEAYNNLGILYEDGRGVPHDLKKALHYYKKAASVGGIDQDKIMAMQYFGGACEMGDEDACELFLLVCEANKKECTSNHKPFSGSSKHLFPRQVVELVDLIRDGL
ncbi:hypothetical protein NHP190003_16030 (plasmid) [Helicobacter sp. NHP19-003]|uniref:beta-lactamase n=1 Tax=Helicobacter gastrocanis TaxID=2849641 RepID=A0ABM7SD39_9HELI|nr:tetratricopeptide repeat protein [Helicobacter sp. NHP19-003]BCZ18321.1 hypothetical protein NHP190003_16030 [Helicobacter sp. NHP19-003]